MTLPSTLDGAVIILHASVYDVRCLVFKEAQVTPALGAEIIVDVD